MRTLRHLSGWRARGWLHAVLAVSLLAVALTGCADAVTMPDLTVKSLVVTPANASLAIGDTVRLVALPKAADGTVMGGVSITWTISDTSRAALVPYELQARVRAKQTGAVTVKAVVATKDGPVEAEATIDLVNPVPTLGTLQPGSLPVHTPGADIVVTGTGFVPGSKVLWNGAERPTVWLSPTAVRVQLTAADLAEARIHQVRVANPLPGGGGSQPLPFEVAVAAVARIGLEPAAATLQVGQTRVLQATPYDVYGNPLPGRVVTWQSGSPTIVTVTAAGMVTAVGPGVAVVTAEAEGQRADALITVTAPQPTGPTLAALSPDSTGTPMDGQGIDVEITGTGFRAGQHVYVNATSRYAEVVSATTIRTTFTYDDIRQPRTLQIRIYDPEAQLWSNALPFVVYPDLEYLVISPGQSSQFLGLTVQLDAVGRDAAGNEYRHPVTWLSETPNVATVDANGRVTTHAVGQAVFRASMKGRNAVAVVNVVAPPAFDLLFESDRTGRPELYLLTPGVDQAPRRLLPAGTYAADPAVSPDGHTIAFVGMDESNNIDIYVADRNGTNVRRLTTAQGEDDQPAWSPDGTMIAFRSVRSGYRDIWVMNADGSGQRNLQGGLRWGAPSSSRPTWSADGSRVAFALVDLSVQGARGTILSVDTLGQNTRLLVATGNGDYDPAFSPDGSYLAFRSSPAGLANQLMVANADGSGLGWIFGSGHGWTPAWSPDSEWLAFASSSDAGLPTDVFVTRLGTGMRLHITTGAAAGGGVNPVWIRR